MSRNFEEPGRSLAVSQQGMVATSHPVSTRVALDVLHKGGNALDAAVAAAAMQGVVEAGSTGIGGDCFVLFSKEGSTDIVAYNGSGRAPRAATTEYFIGKGMSEIPSTSAHAVTVPGAVEAWTRLIREHGRLDIGELLKPAANLARRGYPMTPRVVADLRRSLDRISKNKDASRIFLVDGQAPEVGGMQRQEQLADTLDAIGEFGPDAFYKGAIAEDMVDCLRGDGGLHTLEDFAATRGEYVKPISTDFRGHTIYECPPNGQGIIALMIMNILSRFKPKGGPLDPDNLHIEIEATRLAYAARDRFLAENENGAVPVDYLLSSELADQLAAKIDLSKAIGDLPLFDYQEHKDTVYISVVDKDRNAVSFINSIFSSYGSGIVSPRSGVMLHNRGQSFSLKLGHPNAIGPGKRPLHTIIPGMVAKNGRVVMPFGVMGGHYQAMGHAHFLSKVFDHGLDIQSAMDLPRLFPLPGTNIVECEERIRTSAGAELAKRGFEIRVPAGPIGGSQAVWIDWERNVLFGGSDFRKDGMALGY